MLARWRAAVGAKVGGGGIVFVREGIRARRHRVNDSGPRPLLDWLVYSTEWCDAGSEASTIAPSGHEALAGRSRPHS